MQRPFRHHRNIKHPTSPLQLLALTTSFKHILHRTLSGLFVILFVDLQALSAISSTSTAMSSPLPDDYVGLMTPWKPIAEATMKNATGPHDSTETNHGINVSNLACIKNNQYQAQTNTV